MAKYRFDSFLPLLVFFWIVFTVKTAFSDSFYGTSYIHHPLPEGLSVASFALRFRTSRTRGLLLYAFSDNNHIVIRLKEAKVEAVLALGDHELTLQYKRRPKLNNLKWHSIQVTLSSGRAMLFLDGVERDSETVPEESIGLRDLYVGGSADIESDHLSGADKYFRGCLEDVTIGNINVLAASKVAEGSIYHDITEDCSMEFEADREDPVSLVKETAFILFSKWHIQDKGSFSCWVRTSASQGLLMFSHRGSVFVAAELDGGKVRVIMKVFSEVEPITVKSEKLINDRTWHFVLIEVSSNFIRISIDRKAEQFEHSSPSGQTVEFFGTLYVGGVIHRARALAFNSDLKSITHASTGGSLQGCIQDIELNGEPYSLGDSHATHGLEVGCVYEFPCSENPCEPERTCSEIGPADYICECTGVDCLEDPVVTYRASSPAFLQSSKTLFYMTTHATTTMAPTTARPFSLFSTQPVLVREGGGTRITSANVQINVDLRQYQLRQSQLLFRMSREPQFGRIDKDAPRRGTSRVKFTYLDFESRKISYVHDGSEHFEDQVVFEVSRRDSQQGMSIPDLSDGSLNLTLHIIITPVNDIPEMVLADDNTFRMIQNTKRVLSADFISAYDPDTNPSDVTIDIVSQQANVGYFEHSSQPGQSVTQFTQADINNEDIAYVHVGPSVKSRIALRASDLLGKSGVASFRIEAAPLDLDVANLTSIRTNPAVGQIITPANLRVVTNDPEDMFEVSFVITTPPRLGDVQKQDESGGWDYTDEFTQSDIQGGRVRYIASRVTGDAEVSRDQIGLTARSETATKHGIFLPVEIYLTSIRILVNTGLVLDVVNVGFVTPQNLSSEANHVLDGSPITYQIIRAPMHGYISKHLVGEVDVSQNFTQQDIEDGLITYNLRGQSHNSFNDTLLFRAVVTSAKSEPTDFIITYHPDSAQIDITNTGFTVREGDTYIISPTDLFLQTGVTSDFTYTVTSSPKNGVLQLKDSASATVMNPNVTEFLNYDISRGELQYSHDDSETSFDSFGFTGSSTFLDRYGKRKEVAYSGVVNITVELQNDNSPVRVIDKVFKVIKSGRTVLTAEDLLYTDADTDFDDGDLLYQRQRIDSGNLVKTNDHSETVFTFKQKELIAGKISFKHIGNRRNSRMLFLVFDKGRKHYVAGFLQIEAFESFLDIGVNTGLQLERGQVAVITNGNLSTDTNINVKNRNIEYRITAGPLYGSIMAEGMPIQQFTQESIDTGAITYQHNNKSKNLVDHFNFTVSSKDMENQGQFNIRILIAGKEQLPTIDKMQPVVVEAGKEVVLTKFNLKISHPNNLASEIVYSVTSPPRYGELRLRNEYGIIVSRSPPLPNRVSRKRRNSDSAMHFTQQDVNRGYVSYIQTDYSQLLDEFSFEVSNGYTSLTNITMTIDIAPTVVPVVVHDFTVLEDRSKTITADIIRVGHVLYEPLEFTVHVIENPQSGILENTRQPGEPLTSFTTRDIANEFIYYVHDGSEKSTDGFKIALNNSDGKHSDVYSINITVQQTNDQPPMVALNRGLWAVTGAITPLTNASLSATDSDTPDTNLTYTITPPGNGFIAHKDNSRRPILSFSQSQLYAGDVLFVHQGSRTGGFRFQVSDGVHTTQQQIFSIRASSLLLTLANNTALEISPGSLTPLLSSNLQVVTNEEPASKLSQPITYVITSEPVTGKLVKILAEDDASGSVSFEQTSTFTQSEIDKGIIAFRHENTSSLKEDSFRFDIHLPLSQNLSGIEFQMKISVDTTKLPSTASPSVQGSTTPAESDSSGITNIGIELSEGDTAKITGENLNGDILLSGMSGYVQYLLTKTPTHGFLALSGRNVTVGDTFTQQELSVHGLDYTHDHSDTKKDSFNFTASVKLFGASSFIAAGTNLPRVDGIFKIIILPINDQEFTVVTASLRMTVVQGEKVPFTSQYLNIVDPDNAPDEINIKIMMQPSNGRLVFTDDPRAVVRTFTQADINNERLEFIHNGGSTPGAFLFRVDDGKHFKIKQFFIDVVPRILNVNSITPLVLVQGDHSAVITDYNLNITSNGNVSASFYNVTLLPVFGEIRKNSIPVLSFTQNDIEEGLVVYFQKDMSSATDRLELTLFDDFTVIPNITLTVQIQALIDTKSITVSSNNFVTFLPFYLNTTQLAVKTNSVPHFRISGPPRFGAIVNASTAEKVMTFHSTDLGRGDVIYKADRLDIAENSTVTDNFTLVVEAIGAQPASVVLTALIGPEIIESTTHLPTTYRRTTSVAYDQNDSGIVANNGILIDNINDGDDGRTTELAPAGDPSATEVKDNSSSVIYITISIVIILIVFIVIILVVIWRRRQRKKAEREPVSDEYPDTVTAAPVIQPATPDSMEEPRAERLYESGAVTQPMISRLQPAHLVPQVKVTPLGRPPSPVNSYASLTSNGTFQSSAFSNHWNTGEPEIFGSVRSRSPTLKKSQYWV